MNNKGLVEYAKKCLALGNNSVYVYGTFGQKLTTALCDSKHKQYPNINTAYRTTIYKQLCDGKHYGFDCVGLIKSYLWGGYGNVTYNASQDVSANGMYEKAKVKGNIGTMDKSRVGLLVQMNGHIGIYIGNNEVIECTPATRFATQSHKMGGVCKTRLSDRKWTHWLECPYITYDNPSRFKYRAHVQSKGWMSWVKDGEIAGTVGKGLRLEAIQIDAPFEVKAKAHIQSKGWVDYGTISKDTVIGTIGEGLRLECLQLKGDFTYRVHMQGTGWTCWTKADGIATLGSVGQGLRIEAIQIK